MYFDVWYATYERNGGGLMLFNTIDLNNAFNAGQNTFYKLAYLWWKNKRPTYWSEEEHCTNPWVNCITDTEKALAYAVANKRRTK